MQCSAVYVAETQVALQTGNASELCQQNRKGHVDTLLREQAHEYDMNLVKLNLRKLSCK